MERIDLEQWTPRDVAKLLTLVENEKRYYQEIMALLPMGVAVVGRDGSILSINRSFRQIFGIRHEEASQRSLPDLLSFDNSAQEKISAALSMGDTLSGLPVSIADRQGVARDFRVSIIAMHDWFEENSNDLLVVFEDPGKEAPETSNYLESIGGSVWTLDATTGKIEFGNRQASRLLGPDAVSKWAQRVIPEDAARVAWVYEAAIESGSVATVDYRAVRPDGSRIWLSDRVEPIPSLSGRPTALRVLTMDDNDRREHLQRLAQSRQMEAVTRAASKLSHDFNNLLMIINGNVEEVIQSLPEPDPRRSGLDDVLKGAERMFAITQQLLAISRPPAANLQVIDLNEFLREMKAPVQRRLTKGFEPVSVDVRQLQTIIQSLLEALDEVQESPVYCQTSRRSLISDFGEDMARGLFVRLGIGPLPNLPKELEARWSEPFAWKSKTLASAYGLLRNMGAWVRIVRDGAAGEFEILFPLAPTPEPPPPEPVEPPKIAPPPPDIPVRETVLVVDDEDSIRSLVARVLKRNGYQILEASSSQEALRIAAEYPGAIPMVVSDVMLPYMRGTEMVAKLREKRPQIRALFMSGYTDDPKLAGGNLPPGEGFLQKPFTLVSLVETVRTVLDAPEA